MEPHGSSPFVRSRRPVDGQLPLRLILLDAVARGCRRKGPAAEGIPPLLSHAPFPSSPPFDLLLPLSILVISSGLQCHQTQILLFLPSLSLLTVVLFPSAAMCLTGVSTPDVRSPRKGMGSPAPLPPPSSSSNSNSSRGRGHLRWMPGPATTATLQTSSSSSSSSSSRHREVLRLPLLLPQLLRTHSSPSSFHPLWGGQHQRRARLRLSTMGSSRLVHRVVWGLRDLGFRI